LASYLQETFDDPAMDIAEVLGICQLVNTVLTGNNFETTPVNLAWGVKTLVEIYTSPRWKPAQKTVAHLLRWLGNDPNEGKSLREQLAHDLVGKLRTHKDRKQARFLKLARYSPTLSAILLFSVG